MNSNSKQSLQEELEQIKNYQKILRKKIMNKKLTAKEKETIGVLDDLVKNDEKLLHILKILEERVKVVIENRNSKNNSK